MSIRFEVKLRELERRIERLEQSRLEQLSGFSEANAERHASARRLREAVRKVLSEHPRLRPKQIAAHLPLAELGLSQPPSERTLQEHVAAIRGASEV